MTVGTGGALAFTIGTGKLDTNAVSINGESYTMASSVKELAKSIVRKPGGYFAISVDIDAGTDGLYYASPIPIPFDGEFNGLGHTISKLQVADGSAQDVGLFAQVNRGASISSLSVVKAVVRANYDLGVLAGLNGGKISNVFTSGSVLGASLQESSAGGLVGYNYRGTVTESQSDVGVHGTAQDYVGGLVGTNDDGTIATSFAIGRVSGGFTIGGLVGLNRGRIKNDYSLGNVAGGKYDDEAGGFVGSNYHGKIKTSYSTGAVSGRSTAQIGGFDGTDNSGVIRKCYWDTETSGTDQGSGDGNDAGMKGLTTAQFQSGLPSSFDPTIWAENPNINNGFPYLIYNPPPN